MYCCLHVPQLSNKFRNHTKSKFRLALRRFTAPRGVSKLFVSDNFKSRRTKEVFGYLRSNGVEWKFILEKSPWWIL